jgi:hypothetical protein
MVVLEAECNMLGTLVTNMSKGDHSSASNQVQSVNSNCGKLNEEAVVHRLEVVMEIEHPSPETGKTMLEETTSRHAFC